MTKVSFYVLPEDSAAGNAKLYFACRLAEKAMKHAIENGQHAYMHCDAEAGVGTLDDLLWTFRQGSFVAHERLLDLTDLGNTAPVIIGASEPPATLNGVLINLASEVPSFFSRFDRVAEIVAPDDKEPARKRYQFYKDRGYPLETHKIEADKA